MWIQDNLLEDEQQEELLSPTLPCHACVAVATNWVQRCGGVQYGCHTLMHARSSKSGVVCNVTSKTWSGKWSTSLQQILTVNP
jgi:hypothetical protein